MKMSNYTEEDINLFLENYKFDDCRTWPYYPIVMPLKNGRGPASDEECDEITWEVWGPFHLSVSSHNNLPDAINDAIKRNTELFYGEYFSEDWHE